MKLCPGAKRRMPVFYHTAAFSLVAVGDESTRNIEELVANQRAPKAKKHCFSPRPFPLRPSAALPRRGGAPVAVPADLRAQLRILLSQV